MGLFDSLFGSGDSNAQKYYNNAAVPTIASETIDPTALAMQTVQGVVNPAPIQVSEQAPSAYNNIALDPATRAAQMAALSKYTDIANAGGLDANAKLALQQTIDAANAQDRGAQGAIMRSAQAEGQGGGDFALTQRALESQGASNTGATQGLETAALAEANREAALNQMANIGGGVNASDYAQAQAKANAQNAINAVNQGYTNAANTGNVANKIQTGEFNVGNAQGVNAANTGTTNARVYYNAGLPQQQFNNEIAKAGGQAGLAQNAQNNQAGMFGSLLGTAGTIAGAAMGGPAGAMIGNKIAGQLGPANGSSAPLKPTMTGYAKGGYTCYADGGVAHDHAICMKLGGHIAGEAKVEGDSETNDTVPAMLSPGELVIPRSVPKDGPHMEEFAKHAPVGGDAKKKVDLTRFTSSYKRSR